SGALADATNFRADINLDGVINAADATIVRNRSGTFLP
ncbi:MAG: dockerin type I domain-containing protein, partial [Chthoniobacterales bacterium]